MQYADLVGYMDSAGMPLSPAECHGSICGLLCTGGEGDARAWLEHALSSATGSAPAVNVLRGELSELIDAVAAELADPLVVTFEPLLPLDDQDMVARADALARWAESYLSAMGLGGIPSLGSLSEEAQEALSDLAEIAKLECEDLDSEELEVALSEVHEYLRVVVQILYTELAEGARDGAPEDATLH